MTTTCAAARDSAVRLMAGISQSDEQLMLPLFRDISPRSGLLAKNSPDDERVRRFLQGHLPSGAARVIAGAINAQVSRCHDEIEGRVVLSLDVVRAALFLLGKTDQYRAFQHVLRPYGFCAVLRPGALPDLDESVG